MGLGSLGEAFGAIAGLFSGVSGVGTVLVLAGITLLLVLGIGFLLWFLINIVKQLPKMSVSEFLKFVVVFAVGLIIAGIILP